MKRPRFALQIIAFFVATASAAPLAFADRDHDFHRDRRVLDRRYHHDHYYWPRGYVVESVPRASITVRIGGAPWYFNDGIWYRPHGARFVVAAPPIGAIVPALPPFYTTLWVHGIPYYYANDVYYVWRPEARGYVVSDPPAENEVTVKKSASDDLFIYPKNGQSEVQQSKDRFECHSWANEQTQYDPTRPGGGVSADQANSKRSDYFRAMTACLEGRGYTVK